MKPGELVFVPVLVAPRWDLPEAETARVEPAYVAAEVVVEIDSGTVVRCLFSDRLRVIPRRDRSRA